MELINSKNSYPNLGGTAEVHSVNISTDTNGDGSATVAWDGGLPGTVFVVATGRTSGTVYCSAAGNSQATIQVEGGPASTTVAVNVFGVGGE
jgi:hypothetical protein